jgi:hypothetical protein
MSSGSSAPRGFAAMDKEKVQEIASKVREPELYLSILNSNTIFLIREAKRERLSAKGTRRSTARLLISTRLAEKYAVLMPSARLIEKFKRRNLTRSRLLRSQQRSVRRWVTLVVRNAENTLELRRSTSNTWRAMVERDHLNNRSSQRRSYQVRR